MTDSGTGEASGAVVEGAAVVVVDSAAVVVAGGAVVEVEGASVAGAAEVAGASVVAGAAVVSGDVVGAASSSLSEPAANSTAAHTKTRRRRPADLTIRPV